MRAPEKLWPGRISRWRVRISLLCTVAAVILADPRPWSLIAGMGFTLIGLLLRAWACGHLQKEKILATTGPYRYTRNPLYMGNLLIGIGVVVGSRSWWVLGLSLAFFLLFYPVVVAEERHKMEALFPEDYAAYRREVPLFIPQPGRSASSGKVPFNWNLYKKNKEYRAQVGALIFWLAMALKFFLF